MLESLWDETPGMLSNFQTIPLEISLELAACLDSRRILVEDIQQVIHHAQMSGERFYNPTSGRYKAAHSPCNVTFWVEYTSTQTGCVVHNAYSHRMEVIGP